MQAHTPQLVEVAQADLAWLWQAACAADANAFREIHRRFASTVHGILLGRVPVSDAEDLTQEVFLTIHRRLDRVRDAAALPKWICTIARNAATDWLRRRQRQPAPEPIADDGAATPNEDPELRERVLTHIRSLPVAYCETLMLRLVEGLTGPEIAERTGLTPGSVRVNLSRGLALLRPLIEKDGWR